MRSRARKERYRGVDRRDRLRHIESRPSIGLQLACILLVGAIVGGLLVASTFTSLHLAAMATAISLFGALAAVAAGAAMLGCWKLGGSAAAGWLAVALIDRGVLSVVYRALGSSEGSPGPLPRLVICLGITIPALLALRGAEVDAGLSPVRVLAALATTGFVALALLQYLIGSAHSAWPAAVSQVAAAGCASAWLSIAVMATRSGGRSGRIERPWLITFSALMSAAALLAWTGPISSWTAIGYQSLGLLGFAVAVVGAFTELAFTVHGQSHYALGLRASLSEVRQEVERERAELDERLHDLRNSVTALRTADSTLRHFADRLDEPTRQHLATALTAELSRLQVLIEPGREIGLTDIDLADALEPVIATERTAGACIETALEPVVVRGDGPAIAQVMQNLLVNARTYAPGSPVRIWTERAGDRVLVYVADRGPGIAPADRDRLFERGTRGATSAGTPGQGLGLHISSRLMREIGGRLDLADGGHRGATFVMGLQACDPSGSPTAGRNVIGGRSRHLA
ncbi:MAG TPA: HAMP domain-containing sensor histidine kinase [Acidimicrobiales bacterium]|nr:HAMP domain-containing sensor histidine kinase [Acidimicrobiales bacterium]